jgi:DNA invertase Pin-like site-specific DNA recombinase
MKLCRRCRAGLNQEIKAALARAKARGLVLGRRPTHTHLVEDAVQLRARGSSIREIARALQMSKTWVWKAVQP